MDKITKALRTYLLNNHLASFDIKAVLFDMDGVILDSMPNHAKAWQETMEKFGFTTSTPHDFYLMEGRIASSTMNIFFQREKGRDATPEEIKEMYAYKSDLFEKYDTKELVDGIKHVVDFVRAQELMPILVTGSGMRDLPSRLDSYFPAVFTNDNIVAAYDVEKGKPHPDPFLQGLMKGGNLKPNQAIVIENAPLGIQAAVSAGLFTIAVNTGPLEDNILSDAGASLVFNDMNELFKNLPDIFEIAKRL